MGDIKRYATEVDGKIRMIVDTYCSQLECKETGCCFPDCAELDDEKFESVQDANKKYPNIELV